MPVLRILHSYPFKVPDISRTEEHDPMTTSVDEIEEVPADAEEDVVEVNIKVVNSYDKFGFRRSPRKGEKRLGRKFPSTHSRRSLQLKMRTPSL